ncbi:MAG: thioredoxin family protein [Acidobacteriota bacterium]|nr:thioredoxin family protein [Acidobacteriota bacterium]
MRHLLFTLFLAAMVAVVLPIPATAAVQVNQAAPDFTLPSADGATHSLSEFRGKVVVLEWLNYGCPFVQKHYDSGNMQALQKRYTGEDVVWLSINSSAPGKQGHSSPAEAAELTAEHDAAPTAVLLDPEGEVGKMYGARTTPHMYIIDPDGNLVYNGAIDDKPTTDQADIEGAENYVVAALSAVMDGQQPALQTTKPYGCSVKY